MNRYAVLKRYFVQVFTVLTVMGTPAMLAAQTGFGQGGNQGASQGTGTIVEPSRPQSIPYYVDPSRFYYNRPSGRIWSTIPQTSNPQPSNPTPGTNFNIPVRRPYWGPVRGGYYYGPYYSQPRYYYRPMPGVSVHVGPFIPL